MTRTPYETYLCVGGPLSGKRYCAMRDNGFRVPVRQSVLTVDVANAANVRAAGTSVVEEVFYRHEIFQTPQGDVGMWTPLDQTPRQTIEMLLSVFEDTAK